MSKTGAITELVWLRRDLRLHDNPALSAALATGDGVVAVFCFDHRLLRGRHHSGPRTRFLLECLQDLDRSMRERGSGLIVRCGRPERELTELARGLRARGVHAAADSGPFARQRDERVTRELGRAGVRLSLHPGVFVVDDPAAIRTAAGRTYTVFTHYHRSWLRQPRRDLLAPPDALPPLPSRLKRGRLPRIQDLDLGQPLLDPVPGGEQPGRERMQRFLDGGVSAYAAQRDALRSSSTSDCRATPAPASCAGSCAGATSTPRCCSASRATPAPSTRRATERRSAGTTPASRLRRGARDGPGTR